MQGTVIPLDIAHRIQQYRIGKERSIIYGGADPGDVLVHYAPRAYVQVANFRIAHKALGQAHIQSGTDQFSVGIMAAQVIIERRIAAAYCIIGCRGRTPQPSKTISIIGFLGIGN